MKRPNRRRGRYEHAPDPQDRNRSSRPGEPEEEGWSGLGNTSRRLSRIGPTVKVVGIAVLVLAVTGLWLFRLDVSSVFENRSAATDVTTSTPSSVRSTSTTVPGTSIEGADVDAALRRAGFGSVTAEVDGAVVYLRGVIPTDLLEAGLFSYVDGARKAVLDVIPGAEVRSRLKVRGDAGLLAAELDRLLADRSITFEAGSLVLSEESMSLISDVAQAIIASPGVVVAVAGHTDAAGSASQNREISARRAQAVVDALVSAGVAGNRLAIIAYGEGFPIDAGELERQIDFEVVG